MLWVRGGTPLLDGLVEVVGWGFAEGEGEESHLLGDVGIAEIEEHEADARAEYVDHYIMVGGTQHEGVVG